MKSELEVHNSTRTESFLGQIVLMVSANRMAMVHHGIWNMDDHGSSWNMVMDMEYHPLQLDLLNLLD